MSDAACSGGYESSLSGPGSGPVRRTCIFLEDVKYFFEDVFKCRNPNDVLRYLWAMANIAEGSEGELQVNGDFAAGVEEVVKEVPGKDTQPEVVRTVGRFKLKVIILKGSSHSHFRGLTKLRFKHGARIYLFEVDLPDVINEDYHQSILKEYAALVSERFPKILKIWHNNNGLFARSVVCCGIHFDQTQRRLYFVAIKRPGEWAFIGGDILHSGDRNLRAAAEREFQEAWEFTLSAKLQGSQADLHQEWV